MRFEMPGGLLQAAYGAPKLANEPAKNAFNSSLPFEVALLPQSVIFFVSFVLFGKNGDIIIDN